MSADAELCGQVPPAPGTADAPATMTRLPPARIAARYATRGDDQTPIGDPPDDDDWDDDEDEEDDDEEDDEDPLQACGLIAVQHRHAALTTAQ